MDEVVPPVSPIVPNGDLKAVEREYQRDIAVVQTIPLLQKVGWIAFFVLDIGLCVGVVLYLVMYVLLGIPHDNELVSRMGENLAVQHAVTEEVAAEDVSVGEVRVFSSGQGTYDFYAELENPNTDWYATFSYAFTSSTTSTGVMSGFVLPNEMRPIVAFRHASDMRPIGTELVLTNIMWHRIDARVISNASAWLSDHNDFTFSNVSYGLTPGPGTEVIPTSSFIITNESPFRYWDAEFLLVLKTGSIVVGVNMVTVPGLEPGEARSIDVKWFGGAPASGSITIVPAINYFDETQYMDAPSGDLSEILERL